MKIEWKDSLTLTPIGRALFVAQVFDKNFLLCGAQFQVQTNLLRREIFCQFVDQFVGVRFDEIVTFGSQLRRQVTAQTAQFTLDVCLRSIAFQCFLQFLDQEQAKRTFFVVEGRSTCAYANFWANQRWIDVLNEHGDDGIAVCIDESLALATECSRQFLASRFNGFLNAFGIFRRR